MNDNIDVEREDQRAREDELIRQHQLAQAVEWAEYEGKYGWVRDIDFTARGPKTAQD